MLRFVNRAQQITTTAGAGAITLSGAVPGFQTFAAAGIRDGETVDYVIEQGDAWEVGYGVYSAGTLTRQATESSNGGAELVLSGAQANVYVSGAGEHVAKATISARNTSGVTIPAGSAVARAGIVVGPGRLAIAPMAADGSTGIDKYVGVLAENVAAGRSGSTRRRPAA